MFTDISSQSQTMTFDAKKISPRSLPKRKFTDEDDKKLISVVAELGTRSWVDISNAMGDRNPRQCKERWENYLNPEINNNPWSKDEDDLLLQKQKEIGSKWVIISQFFDHRTDAAVKNRWQLLERRIKKAENLKQRVQVPVKTHIQPIQMPKQEVQNTDFFQMEETQPTISSPEEDYFSTWDIDFGDSDPLAISYSF